MANLPENFDEDFPQKREKIENIITDKDHIHLEKDIYALTAICMLKQAKDDWGLDNQKRAQMIYQAITVTII